MKKFLLAILLALTLFSCSNKQTITISYGVWETTEGIMNSLKQELVNKFGDKYNFKYVVANDSIIIEDFLNDKGQTDVLFMECGTIAPKCNIPYTPGEFELFQKDFDEGFAKYTNIPMLTTDETILSTYELLWVRKDLNVTSIEELAKYSETKPINIGIDMGFWERFNKDGSENVNSGLRWTEYSDVQVNVVTEIDSYSILFESLDAGLIDAVITMDWANGFSYDSFICLQQPIIDQAYFAPQGDYFMCKKHVPEDVLNALAEFRYEFTLKSVFGLTDADLNGKLY